MDELRDILKQQAQRYPRMLPTDAVKLIYQNEFGGGHLIKDEAACLQYLQKEYAAIEKNSDGVAREYIGNGIWRVNLAALKEANLEQLGQDFIRSAAIHKGTLARFLAKLSLLEEATKEGIFSFTSAELADYLEVDRSGLSAEISKMRKEGILDSHKNRFTLL